MGKKGQSSGLKRKPAPRFWPIARKKFTWSVKPACGPHSFQNCIPLAIVLRDVLKFAKTREEAKTITAQGKVRVDGHIRLEDNFPVGLMDIVSLPDAEKNYRIMPSQKGVLLSEISAQESLFKLCRIEDKITLKGGHAQLRLHDGSNLLIKIADPKNPSEDTHETLDTLKLGLPERQILEHIRMKEKNIAVIIGGKNRGMIGRIVEIEKATGKKRRNSIALIEDEKGNRYQTTLNFVFAIGEAQPLIQLSGAQRVE